jgi:hypothetical protein
MLCEDTVSSVVTVRVQLLLHGLPTEVFAEDDAEVVMMALADVVPGLEASQIEIESSTLSLRTITGRHRALSSYSIQLNLLASFVPELAFQYSGTSYNGVKELVSYLGNVLTVASSSGEFLSMIRTTSTEEEDFKMSHVFQTEVIGFELAEITYVGTKTLSYGSKTVEVKSEELELEQSQPLSENTLEVVASFNGFHAALFGAILSVGFVAFIGILVQSLRNRTNENMPSRYVSYSDIDLSISNHYQPSTNSGMRNPTVSL